MGLISEIVEYANGENSKLNDKALSLSGMSSKKVRNLLNKAVSYPNSKYLEIGVWHGSTLYSALYGNSPEYAVAIDNFSEFGGQAQKFLNNTKDVGVPFVFLDENCFSLDKSVFTNKFNVYFYDGGHSELDQENALTYYYECMDDTFIYICDDYNWSRVKSGTSKGLEKCNLKVIEEATLVADYEGDPNSWWNGIWIALLQK
jgi:hypothetical protein